MKTLAYKSGDQMPALGLGTWKSEPGEVEKAVYEAIKIGFRHIDCAPIYGNESEVGEGIKKAINEGIVSREELWITSKLWNDSHRREDVIPALQNTLSDLQVDYLDLYLIHWPVALKKGVGFPESSKDFLSLEEVPITETWEGMQDAYRQELVRHIGVSNFNINKLNDIINECKVAPAINQVEMHPFLPQNELLNFCDSHDIHMTAYSPLGSGDRPEKMKKDNEPTLLEHETIQSVASNHNCSTAQVLIAWALERGTAVIPKSVNKERIQQNFNASEIKLKQDEIETINALNYEYRFVDGEAWDLAGNSYVASEFWD